jgi:trehalose/maltose transport system substrate-binding protein
MRKHLFGAAAALILTASGGPCGAAQITISCASGGPDLALCTSASEAWAKSTGNTVKVVTGANDSGERLALYQQLLASGSSDIDILMIDVIWPGIIGRYLIDLKPYAKGAEKQHFPAIVDNNTVGGRLVAMPLYTDAGLLYYRADLLEKYGMKPPATWQEMTDDAAKIQDGERKAGNDKFWGYVFQGRAYEGLSCNALEWIDSFGGGDIVDADGKITIDNPKAADALTLAASWIGKISPQGALNYSEEEGRGVFQSGNAAFMRNWPYVWALGNSPDSPIKGKIGVAALPKGGADGKHTGTLGGWQYAVSKYSKNPAIAADLVMYLTSRDEQKRRAIVGSYNPTIESLYDDPDVLKAAPFIGELKATFAAAVARPSKVTGSNYNEVSHAFWNAVAGVLAGKQKAGAALNDLAGELANIKGADW